MTIRYHFYSTTLAWNPPGVDTTNLSFGEWSCVLCQLGPVKNFSLK